MSVLLFFRQGRSLRAKLFDFGGVPCEYSVLATVLWNKQFPSPIGNYTGNYAHMSAPFHEVAHVYVGMLIKDRLLLAVLLALWFATFFTVTIVLIELCGLEVSIAIHTVVFHIWLLTAFE